MVKSPDRGRGVVFKVGDVLSPPASCGIAGAFGRNSADHMRGFDREDVLPMADHTGGAAADMGELKVSGEKTLRALQAVALVLFPADPVSQPQMWAGAKKT